MHLDAQSTDTCLDTDKDTGAVKYTCTHVDKVQVLAQVQLLL